MRGFWKGLFKISAWVAGILVVIGGVLNIFFVDLAVVGHNGMAPTLEAGDQVAIWTTASIDMGDVVVCRHPENPNDLVLGRIVGKEGMTLRVHRRQLEVAGTIPDTDRAEEVEFTDTLTGRTATYEMALEILGNTNHATFMQERVPFRLRETRVGAGHLYLLGDNRTHAGQDSRAYGEVREEDCMGQVVMRLKPAVDSPNDLGHSWLDPIE